MGVAAALALAVNVLLVDWVNNGVAKLTPFTVQVVTQHNPHLLPFVVDAIAI